MTISLFSITVVVAAGAAYAVLDLVRKRLMGGLTARALLVWLALLPVPIFWAVAAADGWQLTSAYWSAGLVSIGVNVVANLAFLKALEIAPLGVTIPLLSLTPVFATLLSIRLLGELPNPVQWAGIVCVVLGAFALNWHPDDGVTFKGAWRSLTREKGSLLMVVTALGWSITPPFDKLASEAAGTYEHGTLLNLGVGLAVLLLVVAQGEAKSLRFARSDLGWLLASAVIGFTSLALLLKAYTVAWVGLVEAGRRAVNSVLALVFGRLYFDETVRKAQLAAVALMSVGVALIFL